MSARLFILMAHYEGAPYPHAFYGINETMLRVIGRDHHAAARSKPRLEIIHPDGHVIAQMDEWAAEWIETGDRPTVAGLSRPELAAVLAGLRLLQSAQEVPAGINDILTDSGEVEPLSVNLIDALCERINREGGGA